MLIHLLTMILAIPPWGAVPYGNVPLQRIGLGIQIIGISVMLVNAFCMLFLVLENL